LFSNVVAFRSSLLISDRENCIFYIILFEDSALHTHTHTQVAAARRKVNFRKSPRQLIKIIYETVMSEEQILVDLIFAPGLDNSKVCVEIT
jgi:hypothetical protein